MCVTFKEVVKFLKATPTFPYPSMKIVEGHAVDASNKSWKETKSLSLYLEKSHPGELPYWEYAHWIWHK